MSCPTEGDCGEPNHTTLAGIPICSECGRSTRNRNALICAPCRKQQDIEAQWSMRGTFTASDRDFLSELKVGW